MSNARTPSLTPWVTRLLMVNGIVLLLLTTVFTAPRFYDILVFDPTKFTSRPWTAFTYMYVHGNIISFALNSLVLLLFGPPIERRLGGKAFIAYYQYCGVGAALFALAISAVFRVDPFGGASGAAYGIGMAFVLYWPAAQAAAFPLPFSVTARSLFIGLLIVDIGFGLWGRDGIAHVAHLGGALAGYVFFWLQTRTNRKPQSRQIPVRRPVVTPMRVQETAPELRTAAPIVDRAHEISDEEIDRVLDKISQFGIESLTSQERRFLSEASERKRREQP